MFLLLTLVWHLSHVGATEEMWGKAKLLSQIQHDELATNSVWIQGIRYLHQKTGESPEAMKLPREYSTFHKLPDAAKDKFNQQYPALVHLIQLIDPMRFQQQQQKRFEARRALKKIIDYSNIDLKKTLLSLHQSKQPLDSAIIDELLGLEYENSEAEATIKNKYPSEAWLNQPKELSQTDYELIRKIFENTPPTKNTVVYDLGSGYGRFLLYGGILFPDVQFKGIEIVKERVKVSRNLAERLKLKNVSFVAQDVLAADFSDGSYFYIFNSFPSIEGQVIQKIALIAKKKKVTIVCLGNIYKTLLQTPWLKQTRLLDQWQQLAVFESIHH